jgi:hypothetical protein
MPLDPTNRPVIIVSGEFAGSEGFCLGLTHSGLYAVTPDGANKILALRFDHDFGRLVNKGQQPKRN